MKLYSKAPNCGPVPYPDQSGKTLTDGVVSGEEWAPLEELGFVVSHVATKTEVKAIKAVTSVEEATAKVVLITEVVPLPEVIKPATSVGLSLLEMAKAAMPDEEAPGDVTLMEAAHAAAKAPQEVKKSDKKHSKIKATE